MNSIFRTGVFWFGFLKRSIEIKRQIYSKTGPDAFLWSFDFKYIKGGELTDISN